MESVEQILTDEQINNAWGNANFGESKKRDVVANALLKYASGYKTGHTIQCICHELGLIRKHCNLSTKGKQYLYAHFSRGLSV
jgi:hemoglobin-like flavoprotein